MCGGLRFRFSALLEHRDFDDFNFQLQLSFLIFQPCFFSLLLELQ